MQFKSIADSAILKHQYSKTCLKRPIEKKDQKCFLRQIVAKCRSRVLQNAPILQYFWPS